MSRFLTIVAGLAVVGGGALVAIRMAAPPVESPAQVRTIVNVHEHIESADEAEALLEIMDQTGVAMTLLMGSSRFTITESQADGFTRVEENNAEILEMARRWPDRFQAWPTIDPADPAKLDKLKGYVEQGAKGLKLYIGHGLHDNRPGATGYFFHTRALDDPGMLAVFAYCESTGLPVLLHVNPGPTAPGFAEEFIAVLKAYPALKVIAPHFVLSSIKSSRLRELLDAFPHLYSDISFGHDDFLSAGLKRISRSPKKFQALFADYPDRFMFGTDVVVTAVKARRVEWMAARFRAYLDMLSKAEYTTEVVPGKTLRGLALEPAQLEAVLWRNFEKFSALDAKRSVAEQKGFGVIEWKKMGIPREDRAAGTMLPRDRWDAWRARRKAERARKQKEKREKKKAKGGADAKSLLERREARRRAAEAGTLDKVRGDRAAERAVFEAVGRQRLQVQPPAEGAAGETGSGE